MGFFLNKLFARLQMNVLLGCPRCVLLLLTV
jgi:hypothetical protein